MRLSDENIRGRTVISSDGSKIGEVALLFIDSAVDSDAWRVESLQVKLQKESADRLGAEHSIFRSGTLEIPIRMVQSLGDAVVLNVAVDELRQVLPNLGETSSAQ